ncbi:MAG TPA: glucose 1-dehydrogenase [Candidatus Dormibacteraeota bacterium]|nr:glucose 1-dehydrogenase [Candidatus Dormibacteraeota bacterium]
MTGRLESKVAVVTGSSGGIGRSIAEAFAAEGAAIVINSRSAARATAVAEELARAGRRVLAFEADVQDPDQADAMAQAAVRQFGRLDVWVNNAGVNVIGPSVEMKADDWRRVIDTNLSGCFFGSQAAARVMLPHKSGVIIQIGSIFGQVGLPTRAPYTTAKHGLVGMTKALAAEWAGDNVRVVCLEPGYIAAGLGLKGQELGAFTAEEIERRTPMHRLGRPLELARVAVFLASDEASFMTGGTITVDGGWVAYGGWGF